MKLTLKNIGKIGDASVEINGITVIAGENNTGKSTVGRALFAVFNSFFNIQKQIQNERAEIIEDTLDRMYINTSRRTFRFIANTNVVAETIASNPEKYRSMNSSMLKDKIFELLEQNSGENVQLAGEKEVEEPIAHLSEILNISDSTFLESVLEKKLSAEFNDQVCNIFSEDSGEIQLWIKNDCINVNIDDEGTVNIQNPANLSLHTETIYIDDPFVIDDPNIFLHRNPRFFSNKYLNHQEHLKTKLFYLKSDGNVFEEILIRDKLDSIYDKLLSVCSGNVVRDKRAGFGYKKEGSDKVLNVRNLSTGLKTFVILKTLIENGTIESNGTIILDEPEIHLHPEWQLLFAEIIVLIQKEFGIHILMNTHSPYFLNAIEVYSAKYGIDDKCKYYLSSSQDGIGFINDVTNNIEAIYSKLARPLQDLENEGGRLC